MACRDKGVICLHLLCYARCPDVHLSEDHLAYVVEPVMDHFVDCICLSVMLAEFGHWSQSLRITANRQTIFTVQKVDFW